MTMRIPLLEDVVIRWAVRAVAVAVAAALTVLAAGAAIAGWDALQ